jgi:hypothetical protein
MTLARSARPETEIVFDPSTYVDGVPFEALARLRTETPVAWVAETPVLGWPAGPGSGWCCGTLMPNRLPGCLFSSWLGATQIRDPATPQALGYVRQMMLNMDPPDHSRLRRLLARSFTRRAVSQLEDRIRGHARAICDRVFRGARGECDFAKDVAADLPLLTLADVLGVPQQDRWLLFDWSNRVIGYQDPDYASSAEFDPAAGTPMARQAHALRPVPGSDGRMPDPRTRPGMPDLYAYAHLLAEERRRRPGPDVMSILLAQADDDGGQVSVAEFENMFWLFAVAGNETLQRPAGRMLGYSSTQRRTTCSADPALMPPRPRVAALVDTGHDVPPDRKPDCELSGQHIGEGDKVVIVVHLGQPRRSRLHGPDRFGIRAAPQPHLVFGHGPTSPAPTRPPRCARYSVGSSPHVLPRVRPVTPYLRSNFQRGVSGCRSPDRVGAVRARPVTCPGGPRGATARFAYPCAPHR